MLQNYIEAAMAVDLAKKQAFKLAIVHEFLDQEQYGSADPSWSTDPFSECALSGTRFQELSSHAIDETCYVHFTRAPKLHLEARV